MAQSKEITLTEAVRELSVLDKRIQKASAKPMAVVIRGDKQVLYPSALAITEAQVMSNAQAFFDLLAYRDALRSAVLASNNAEVLSEFGITVAAAIDKKKRIRTIREYHRTISNGISNASEVMRTAMDYMNTEIRKTLSATDVEASDYAVKASKVGAEVRERLQPKLHIPEVIHEYVDKELEALQSFEDNLDVALNLHNAKTMITITW